MAELHEISENDARKYETFEKYVIKCTKFYANWYDKDIEKLEGYKGKDTKSMISLVIPPDYPISKVVQSFEDELGSLLSNNIEESNCYSFLWKARVDRPSYSIVIQHAIRCLKESHSCYPYGRYPHGGLLLYCGLEVYSDRKKEYMVKFMIESPTPVKDFICICDNKFHVEPLKELNHSWKLLVMAKRYEIFYEMVEPWERLIELIDFLKGKGTKSMISLIIPPSYKISGVVQLLEDELRNSKKDEEGSFHFLWNRNGGNRGLIRYVIRTFKRFKRYGSDVPCNGLVRFTGLIYDEESGKSRIEDHQFEPLTPVQDLLFKRDDRFHMEVVKDLVKSWKSYVALMMAPLAHVPTFRGHLSCSRERFLLV